MENISYSNLQLLNRSVGNEGGVLTMGIVSDKVDTYNTWLNPEGNDTPPQTIIIDFNHQNEPTGATMLRTYIGYVLAKPDGSFDIQNVPTDGYVKTLIGDILIPKTSRMLIKNGNGGVKDLGSLYEAVKEGRVAWGSVQFDPAPYPEETKTDKNGRIYYGKYRITYFTLLDKAPSQDMAFKFNQQNFRMTTNIRSWDGQEAEKELKNYATEDGKLNEEKYEKGFAYQDGKNSKLPIYNVVDGELKLNPDGVHAAMAALNGARGGVKIPESEKEKVHAKLVSAYKELGEKDSEIPELKRNNTNTMSFKQHDLAKHTDEKGKERMVRISRLDKNEEDERTYECRDLDNKEYTASESSLSEPSNEEMREYIKEAHKKMDGEKRNKKDEEKEDRKEEKKEPAQKETDGDFSETKKREEENDDTKADTKLFNELIKPLADRIDSIAKKLEKLSDEKEERKNEKDETEKRSIQNNPAYIPVDKLPASEESRGILTPASLSNEDLNQDEKIKQYKLNKQYYTN